MPGTRSNRSSQAMAANAATARSTSAAVEPAGEGDGNGASQAHQDPALGVEQDAGRPGQGERVDRGARVRAGSRAAATTVRCVQGDRVTGDPGGWR